MMSRVHYKSIAFQISVWLTKARESRIGGKTVAIGIAKDLATYFRVNNPRFDEEKFLKACGVKK